MIYLLRHGAIDWPEADCFIGQLDAPLSAEGRSQAGAWRDVFRKVPFSAVWSSDLARAAETARIVFEDRQGAVRASRELREIGLGEWEGRPRGRVREEQPDLWEARGADLAGFRPPGGESFRDLQERALRAVTGIATEAAGDVCLVVHGGVIRVLVCHYLEMPLSNLFRLRIDYTGLSVVSWSPAGAEVCALNLKPSCSIGPPGGGIGGRNDPSPV